MAKLYFKYGAMNSGKSTLLMQVAHNYEENNMQVIVMKPSIDTKGNDKLVSRIGIERKFDYLLYQDDSVYEKVKDVLPDIKCILIDEAQFLTAKQVEELFCITKIKDTSVMCYGLRNDFKTNMFPGSKRLFELADDIEELTTICKCGKKAKFNARMMNGKLVSDGSQVAIDGVGETTYIPLCGECYLKYVKKFDNEICKELTLHRREKD